jgi:hypothetical protein
MQMFYIPDITLRQKTLLQPPGSIDPISLWRFGGN